MSKSFLVPLDPQGNQKTWISTTSKGDRVEPWEFEDTLIYIGYTRGRSALNIQWKSLKTKKTYESGMSLLDEALKEGKVNKHSISGKFGFKKQGTSVLLKILQWN